MKTITLIAIAATMLAASLGASAQTSIDSQSTTGETRRAEVRAELLEALAQGTVSRGEFSYVAPTVGQPKSRDEVRADLAAARANQELARGEFAYLAEPPVGQPKTREQVLAELAAARANHELARGEFAYLPRPQERSHSALAQRGAGGILQ